MASSDLPALREWVKRHAQKWRQENYTPEDIANLAIACGFSRIAVAEWQTRERFAA